jgi:hypothetical protein
MAEGVPSTTTTTTAAASGDDYVLSPKEAGWKACLTDMHQHYDTALATKDVEQRMKLLAPLLTPLEHATGLRRGILHEVALILLGGGAHEEAEALVREHGLLVKALKGKESKEWLHHLRLQTRLDMEKGNLLGAYANLIRASGLAAKLGQALLEEDCLATMFLIRTTAKWDEDAVKEDTAMEDVD